MASVYEQWKIEMREMGVRIDSVLLIGQSNMAGRGIIGSVPPIDYRGMLFMLRNGRWQPMSEPINPDRTIYVSDDTQPRSGISLGASFADSYADAYDKRIGLIPCADGGTKMDQWMPGEVFFDHAVMQAKLAQRTSDIRGILWHQGESDAIQMGTVENYTPKFFKMLDTLLEQLQLDEKATPVIVGEIAPATPNLWPYTKEFNAMLHELVKCRPNLGVVSADGLSIGPDGMHFTGPSYREFGRRYFAAFDEVRSRLAGN